MRQLMCIECGATRPKLVLPARDDQKQGILYMAFMLHALSGLNSSLPSTRDYWRAKIKELLA